MYENIARTGCGSDGGFWKYFEVRPISLNNGLLGKDGHDFSMKNRVGYMPFTDMEKTEGTVWWELEK